MCDNRRDLFHADETKKGKNGNKSRRTQNFNHLMLHQIDRAIGAEKEGAEPGEAVYRPEARPSHFGMSRFGKNKPHEDDEKSYRALPK